MVHMLRRFLPLPVASLLLLLLVALVRVFFLGLRDARSVVGVVVEIYLSQQTT